MRMKRNLILVLCAAVFMAACGDGNSKPSVIVELIKAAQPVAVYPDSSLSAAAQPQFASAITVSSDGAEAGADVYRLKRDSNNKLIRSDDATSLYGYETETLTHVFTPKNLVWTNGSGNYYETFYRFYAKADTVFSGRIPADYAGYITHIDRLAVGGRRGAYQYTDFGYWASSQHLGSSGNDSMLGYQITPFVIRNNSDISNIVDIVNNGATARNYNGRVLAGYTSGSLLTDIKQGELQGDVHLYVDFANREMFSKMYLYNMDGSSWGDIHTGYRADNLSARDTGHGILINDNGTFNSRTGVGQSTNLTLVLDNGNTPLVNSHSVSGAFLGPNGEEMSGIFNINAADIGTITGAFGAK